MKPNRLLLTLLLVGFAAILTAGAPSARAAVQCIACDKAPLTPPYWKSELGMICEDCNKLARRCWICSLPAAKDYKKTADGRYICRREAKSVVIDEPSVQQTFQRTRNAVLRMTRGYMKLQQPEINVEVFSQPVWDPDGSKSAMHRQGLATTRRVGKQYHHNVMLINGLVNTNLIGVCAHEFTHLWINENRGKHEIEPQTMEAVCEMVAYSLAKTYRHRDYMETIRDNTYTEGRAARLIPLVDRYGLKALLRWVREGTTSTPSATELARMKSNIGAPLNAGASPGRPTGSPLYDSSGKGMTKKPSKLALKGIIGSPGNYTALVSGVMFREGESHSVKIDGGSTKVRCLKIDKGVVTVQVDGSSQPVQLLLR